MCVIARAACVREKEHLFVWLLSVCVYVCLCLCLRLGLHTKTHTQTHVHKHTQSLWHTEGVANQNNTGAYTMCTHSHTHTHTQSHALSLTHRWSSKPEQTQCLHTVHINTHTYTLIERNPPSRGGFLFAMFPDHELCVRGPPSKDLYQVLRGGSSYTRFLMRELGK